MQPGRTSFRKITGFIPMLAVMAAIFYVSHQPGHALQLPDIVGIDKLLHAVAYGLLAITVVFAVQPFMAKFPGPWLKIGIVLFCFLYGISDEFHQSFIPNRYVSIWDVAADTAGGLAVAVWWWKSGPCPS